jgi:PAS domain S-box-containing protein
VQGELKSELMNTAAPSKTNEDPFESLTSRYNAIIESSDDAIISKTLDGIIQSWNPAAQRIFGYTPEEAIGKPVLMLIPRDRANEEASILERIRRGERTHHYETVRRCKDGALVDISLTVSPIKDATGKVVGASKIARDITENVRIRKQLEQAKSALAANNAELEKRIEERTFALNEAILQMQEFSYTVSHDLRSPVRAIKGYATAVLEMAPGRLDEKGMEHLKSIIRCSLRMEKLIRDVLTYSRINAAKSETVETDVEKVISEIILNYDEFKPPKLKVVLQRPLLHVMANEMFLIQSLANLFNNAVKFVAPGTAPKVEIWTERRGDQIRIFVKDNGIGIKKEHQARIFGLFERAHQDKSYEGTGVGLAIARKSVEKMAGTIGIESDGINGCAFWIELASPPLKLEPE